jgi:hypothetical protein
VIAEAIDTLITLGWAAIVWLVVLAAAAALVLTTIVAAILATARGLHRAARWAWHGTPGPTWARNRITARRIARTYKEAA